MRYGTFMRNHLPVLIICLAVTSPLGSARAQSGSDEPGLGSGPAVVDHGRPASRVRLGTSRLRATMTLQAAYTHGFHEGLGWSGIMGGPQLIFAIPTTVLGASAVGVGIWQIATHRQSTLPGARHRRVYNSAFVKGMGLGMLITGVLNMTVSGMLLFYDGGVVWGGDDEFGETMNTALFIAGGVELLAGGIMTLAGHLVSDKILQNRLSLAPSVFPGGGGGVMLGGVF